ncbi:MAG: hypothetical protein OXL37_02780 [Chloroflexota bacterium]|nr:hypothetical protein [Chloroflexota bacterium]MDE2961910.1 hypothetical protein [Chloroflexota bacterium]
MPRVTSNGICELCGKSYRKSGMTRHLQSCLAKTAPHGEPRRRHGNSIHLLVEDDYRPEYWMHLAVPSRCTLEELDLYLRKTWLECCLHLSSFSIGRDNYFCPEYFLSMYGEEDEGGNDPLAGLAQIIGLLREDMELEMTVPLGQVVHTGSRFRHEYDFGTTTELTLRVLGEPDGGDDEIRLLARNDAPAFDCHRCGAPAAWVSPGADDWIAMTAGLCDACAPTSEYRLPIVNSPRSGVCGYDGTPVWIVVDNQE